MSTTPVMTWFEIPSVDYHRAVRFYQTVFAVELKQEVMENMPMAVFPHQEGQTAGAVIHGESYQPSENGVVIYLYSTDFDRTLERVGANGGKVVMPKMSIGENGVIAQFMDTEGNRIGLHSMS